MNDVQIEMTFIFAIAKIAAIVYLMLHLFAVLVITRQVMVAGRVIKTALRGSVMLFALLHAIILFGLLIYTVFANPLV
ncbi:MAG: hypothetical protein ACE5DX_03180 [Candidatus Dojkabacteria bacterium]